MGLLKYALLGAAAVYGYQYATKKRVTDGKSLVDDFKEKSPEIIDKIKEFGLNIKRDFRQTSDLY
jgi:hypothetical protein